MKSLRLPKGLVATLALGLVFIAGGCSDESAGPGSVDNDPDLSAQFGGYETTDELPAFGDEQLIQDLEGEVSFDDPIADEPETRELEDDPDGTRYAVTLRWGVLERKPNGDLGGGPETVPVDWSGSLTTSAGRIVLRHLYSFEDGDDAVMPRDDAAVLEWISETQGGVDGLTIVVFVPADLPGDLSEETLVLDTAAFDLTLSFDQLAEWDQTYDVGETGNQIRVNAMESRAAVSTRGWVMGRWGWDTTEDLGRFEGQWVHPRTGIDGFLRGHFGPDPASDLIAFYGKYIDRAGNFEGLLRGTVRISEGNLEQGLGTFQGGWYSETGEAEGAVRGRWVAGGERGGYFSGIWCATCPVSDGLGGGGDGANGNEDDDVNGNGNGDDDVNGNGNADDVGGENGGGSDGGGGNGGSAGGGVN